MSDEQSVHCRFCLCQGRQSTARLYRVCGCHHPSLRYAHLECFEQHQLNSGSTVCDLCRQSYSIAIQSDSEHQNRGVWRRVALNREEIYFRLSSLADFVIVTILYTLVVNHVDQMDKTQGAWWLEPLCQYLSLGLAVKTLYHLTRWITLVRTITAS